MLKKCPKFDIEICQNLRFLEFSKKEKWCVLNRKISVTKVWKSKIWDDRFLGFYVAFIVVYSFFFRYCFHREICRSKSPVLEIFKKTQKRAFLYSKIGPLEMIFFACFPTHLFGLSERYALSPQTLIGDSAFIEIWPKQNRPFSKFSSKISIFSLIKIWSKRSLKIAQKRRFLRKKLIKSTLKYMDRGAFSTY